MAYCDCRVSADVDEVTSLKMALDRWERPTDWTDAHTPASLLTTPSGNTDHGQSSKDQPSRLVLPRAIPSSVYKM